MGLIFYGQSNKIIGTTNNKNVEIKKYLYIKGYPYIIYDSEDIINPVEPEAVERVIPKTYKILLTNDPTRNEDTEYNEVIIFKPDLFTYDLRDPESGNFLCKMNIELKESHYFIRLNIGKETNTAVVKITATGLDEEEKTYLKNESVGYTVKSSDKFYIEATFDYTPKGKLHKSVELKLAEDFDKAIGKKISEYDNNNMILLEKDIYILPDSVDLKYGGISKVYMIGYMNIDNYAYYGMFTYPRAECTSRDATVALVPSLSGNERSYDFVLIDNKKLEHRVEWTHRSVQPEFFTKPDTETSQSYSTNSNIDNSEILVIDSLEVANTLEIKNNLAVYGSINNTALYYDTIFVNTESEDIGFGMFAEFYDSKYTLNGTEFQIPYFQLSPGFCHRTDHLEIKWNADGNLTIKNLTVDPIANISFAPRILRYE